MFTRMKLFCITWVLPLSVILGACTKTIEVPVIKEVPVEIKVPVAQPCVSGNRPEEVKPLRDRISREEWEQLSTDQRENLLGGQSLDRKGYGDRLAVATAGCH